MNFEFKQQLDHEIQIYRKSKWVMIFLIAQPIETNLDKKFLILVVSKFEKCPQISLTFFHKQCSGKFTIKLSTFDGEESGASK